MNKFSIKLRIHLKSKINLILLINQLYFTIREGKSICLLLFWLNDSIVQLISFTLINRDQRQLKTLVFPTPVHL